VLNGDVKIGNPSRKHIFISYINGQVKIGNPSRKQILFLYLRVDFIFKW